MMKQYDNWNGKLLYGLLISFFLGVVPPAQAKNQTPIIAVLSTAMLSYAIWGDEYEVKPAESYDLRLGVGWVDPTNQRHESVSGQAEIVLPKFYWKLAPILGINANTEGGIYAYGGLNMQTYLSAHIYLTPSLAVAGRYRGDGKKLGSNLLFRSSFIIGYEWDEGEKLNIEFSHLSHADLFDNYNPGLEEVSLNYSIPFTF